MVVQFMVTSMFSLLSVGQVEAGQRISTTLTAAVLAVAAVAQSSSP